VLRKERSEVKLTHGKGEEQVIQLCCIKYKQSSLERAEQSLERSADKKGGESKNLGLGNFGGSAIS
jgi:hypothetical protein